VLQNDRRRVLLVTGSRLTAEALMFALDSHPAIDAIGYGTDGWDAIELVSSYEPDVVVVGPNPQGLEPLQLTSLVHDFFPAVAVVVISERGGETQSRAAANAGAAVCLTDSSSADELLHAITTVQPARNGAIRVHNTLSVARVGHTYA